MLLLRFALLQHQELHKPGISLFTPPGNISTLIRSALRVLAHPRLVFSFPPTGSSHLLCMSGRQPQESRNTNPRRFSQVFELLLAGKNHSLPSPDPAFRVQFCLQRLSSCCSLTPLLRCLLSFKLPLDYHNRICHKDMLSTYLLFTCHRLDAGIRAIVTVDTEDGRGYPILAYHSRNIGTSLSWNVPWT